MDQTKRGFLHSMRAGGILQNKIFRVPG